MSNRSHGAAVVDGVVQYTSASQIDRADHDVGGCLRKWYYRYVDKLKEPSTTAQERGKRLHADIERYLTTGVDALDSIITPIRHYLPPRELIPFARELVETPIAGSGLTAAGVPVVGYIDLINPTPWRLRSSGPVDDPAGSVEELDWKFTSDFKWAKTPEQVGKATPMLAYGLATGADHVRLSHVYACTRRRDGMKSTITTTRDQLLERWQRIHGVVERIKDTAKAPTADDTDHNLSSCSAFGGCPYRTRCAAHRNPLQMYIDNLNTKTETKTMSNDLIANLFKNAEGAPPAPAAAPATPAPEATLDMSAQIAAFQAAEAAAQQSTPIVGPLLERVRACKFGTPEIAGDLLTAYYAEQGKVPNCGSIAGSGMLGGTRLRTVAELEKTVAELESHVAGAAAQAAPAPAVAPPDVAPDLPTAEAVVAAAPVAEPSQMPDAVLAQAPDVCSIDLKKLKKPELLEHALKMQDALRAAPTTSEPAAAPTTDAPPTPSGLRLYVNCVPHTDTEPTGRLEPYVADLAQQLAAHFGEIDIRCPQSDKSPITFGKWKGALAAGARQNPPPDGAYAVDTRGNEFAEVVVDALRELCSTFVRGI